VTVPLAPSWEPSTEEEHLRLRLAATCRASPGRFMCTTSRGTRQYAPHLQLLDDALLDAVEADEGRLIVSLPVRGGKSELCSRALPAWYLGMNPTKEVILAGHEATFATEHGGAARDLLNEWGPSVFGVTVNPTSRSRKRWSILDHKGGMLSIGVNQSPIGRGGDLVVVDDPLKSLADAMNDEVRRKINEVWWQGVMESRIAPGGTVIIVCSRWHEDDLSGYLKTNFPADWKELHIEAIATKAGAERDPLGRQPGDPYWPQRWPKRKMEQRRERSGGEASIVWNAQYQGTPLPSTGTLFDIGRLRYVARPDSLTIDWCRAWDLAASEDTTADYTVGVLIGRYRDSGRWIIADVVRGQWHPSKVRAELDTTAELDGRHVEIELPQDPGQAGKDQGQQLVARLSGFFARAIPQSGSKVTRALGLSAQVGAGNVDVLCCPPDEMRRIVAGLEVPARDASEKVNPPWLDALVAEFRLFDRGTHDDQVDAASSGFNRLARLDGGTTPGDADDAFAGAVRTGN
jgi:predicted phage terminase large subunit-like protein